MHYECIFLSSLERSPFTQNRGCHFLKWDPSGAPGVRCIVLSSITSAVISKAGVDERKLMTGHTVAGLAALSLTASLSF